MKQIIFTCLLLVALCSCGSSQHKEAQGQVRKTQDAIRPGTIATSGTGYMMKATLNGKIWAASSMVSPEVAGRIVGYSGKDYIGLPYSKTDIVIGKKISLVEDNAPDLAINNGCLRKDIKGDGDNSSKQQQRRRKVLFYTFK